MGQQIAALAGLGILQLRQQGIGVDDRVVGMLAQLGCGFGLLESPERSHHDEGNQQYRSRQQSDNLMRGVHRKASRIMMQHPWGLVIRDNIHCAGAMLRKWLRFWSAMAKSFAVSDI